jgi:chromosome segregation ATPase
MKIMSDKSKSEFKISLDDGVVDPDDTRKPTNKPEAVRKKRGEKPDRNLSLFSFVPVALIAVVMIAGYLDIRNRLLSFHSAGSQETRNLAEDLQSKFSSLTIKFSTLEESTKGLTEAGSTLSASVSSLNEALKKTDKSISGIKASKADKNSLDNALKEIEKRVSPLSEAIKKTATDTAIMSAKLNASITEMTTVSAKVSDDIKAMELVVETLQSEKASKKELLTEIDHLENVLNASRNQSEKQASDFATSIRRLELKISSLEAKAGLAPSSSNKASGSKPALVVPGEQTSGSPSPTPAQSGDLIERDITQ